MSFDNLNLNPRPCRDDDHDIRATRWRHPTRRRICASIYRSEGHRRRGGGGKVQKARYSGPAMYRSKTRLPGSGRRRAPPPVSVPWFAHIDKVRVTYVTSGAVRDRISTGIQATWGPCVPEYKYGRRWLQNLPTLLCCTVLSLTRNHHPTATHTQTNSKMSAVKTAKIGDVTIGRIGVSTSVFLLHSSFSRPMYCSTV